MQIRAKHRDKIACKWQETHQRHRGLKASGQSLGKIVKIHQNTEKKIDI